jgi:hypothetical protein
MGLAFWENGCTTLPFFEPCPYTWKGEILHSSWSLEISFFSKFSRLKLEYRTAWYTYTNGSSIRWLEDDSRISTKLASLPC